MLIKGTTAGRDGDDTEAMLSDLYPDVSIVKALLGPDETLTQAQISCQTITELERPGSKTVGKLETPFRQVKSALR